MRIHGRGHLVAVVKNLWLVVSSPDVTEVQQLMHVESVGDQSPPVGVVWKSRELAPHILRNAVTAYSFHVGSHENVVSSEMPPLALDRSLKLHDMTLM
ncbi:hypothetical protein TNCV_4804731 [Trichonephila clavipes]|nr:hypothetical protein TNCV_4804731 [Trichonephila clavipes]